MSPDAACLRPEVQEWSADIVNLVQPDGPDVGQSSAPPRRGRLDERRCVSCAEAALRTRSCFSSPDRFLTPRAESMERQCAFRVGKAPHSLSPRERNTRHRDPSADPFHCSSSSKSSSAISRAHRSPSRPQRPPHFTPSFVHADDASPDPVDANGPPDTPRQISAGAIWNVGGPTVAQGTPRPGIPDGHGRLLASGTNGLMYTAHFLDKKGSSQDLQQHEDRLALALDIDQSSRVLALLAQPSLSQATSLEPQQCQHFKWQNNSWSREEGTDPGRKIPSKGPSRSVPALPFRVLDAPRLRDDFYCSTLAYSNTCRTLAVGLSSRVYLWTEDRGVRFPPLVSNRPGNYVTCLSFSSEAGGKSILAVGRQSGLVSLMSPLEEGRPRFQMQKSNAVSCVAFKPTTSLRTSSLLDGAKVECEDLLIGDDVGDVHYYSIEWPRANLQANMPAHPGQAVQLAKLAAHSQQICGMAWSPDGKYFATGGNDNLALLFEVAKVLQEEAPARGRSPLRMFPSRVGVPTRLARRDPEPGPQLHSPPVSPERQGGIRETSPLGQRVTTPSLTPIDTTAGPMPPIPSAPMLLPSPRNLPLTPPTSPDRAQPAQQAAHERRVLSQPRTSPPHFTPIFITHGRGLQTHTFPHSAAVKAMAFAPWQPNLLATGGGSNDRQIHFFHTGSSATLALINVFAQVTSLIWSKTKRELCATFGYAQPEHGIRIAVFAWPSGDCVVSIPWGNYGGVDRNLGDGGGRALWAVAFPGGPNDERRRRVSRNSSSSSNRGRRGQQSEGQRWGSRTQEEGCIVVAGSDESVKFHEVWTGEAKSGLLGNAPGVLGGSLILEAGHGVDELAGSARSEIIR